MKVDLAKVNEKLKSREKRTHQSVAPVSKEFKDYAVRKIDASL